MTDNKFFIQNPRSLEEFIVRTNDDSDSEAIKKNSKNDKNIILFKEANKLPQTRNKMDFFYNREVAPRDATYVAPKFVNLPQEPVKIEIKKPTPPPLPLNISGKTTTEYKEYDPEILEKALEEHIKDNSKLKGLAGAFIEIAKEYGVDPLILIGIAMVESGRGLSEAAKTKNNFGGLCDHAQSKKLKHWVNKRFDKPEDCIDKMASTLKSFADSGRNTIGSIPPYKPGGRGWCGFEVRETWIKSVVSNIKDISKSYNAILEEPEEQPEL